MHVHGALRRASGAAGEVQQGEVFGLGRHRLERVCGLRHQRRKVSGAGDGGRATLLTHQRHVA